MSTVKMIKNDAIVPIELGAGFIQKLQGIMFSLVEDKTQEEIELFKTLSEKGEEMPEPWMEHVQTLYALLAAVQESAEKNGLVFDKSVDDISTPAEN